jgi:GWxTD domain-containing protein
MRINHIFGMWLLSVLFVLPASAVTFDVDYATYADLAGDRSHTYVEVYTRVDRWSLSTHTVLSERRYGVIQDNPDTVMLGFTADVVITNSASDTVVSERHVIDEPARSEYSGTAYDDLFTTWGYNLKPGDYTLRVEISDHYSDAQGAQTKTLEVRSYPTGAPMISDTELALSIGPDDTGSRFSKSGLAVLANARRLFGYGASVLFFYTELYNLNANTKYMIVVEIQNEAGERVRKIGTFPVQVTSGMGVIAKGANVMGYADGAYHLRLFLTSQGHTLATTITPFEVSRSPVVTQFVAQRFTGDVGWIATRKELRDFKKATPEQKAVLIRDFWSKRDPTPGTLPNEFKSEHYRRLSFADQLFLEVGRPGRDADMGRVYVVYGPPTDIEKFPSEANTKEYQIWNFQNLDGAPEFIFADLVGTGNWSLIHSTARNEVRNNNWEEVVRPYEGSFQRQERGIRQNRGDNDDDVRIRN